MSNTQRSAMKPVVPAGDMGLGLCIQCLGAVIADGENAPPPNFGITLAPMPWPVPTPAGEMIFVVAVPACWGHVQQMGQAAQQPHRRPLLVANGKL